MKEENRLLESGMRFPPQVNKATGRFEMVSDKESIKESVYLILMTQKGERLIHPEFGSNIRAFAFMDGNISLLNLMAAELERDIRRGEPRISHVEVNVVPGSGDAFMDVMVDYTIMDTNQRDRIVFPFYSHEERGVQL